MCDSNMHILSGPRTQASLTSRGHHEVPFARWSFLGSPPSFPPPTPALPESFLISRLFPDSALPLGTLAFWPCPFAAATLPSNACSPPPSLLFPKALDLLSLETVTTHSFFPELGPAGPRNQSVAHQRPASCCHSRRGI